MLAVAGSGKTTFLIDRLNLEQRFLLVTYTRNNYEHLRRSITRKFGFFPENIKVLKYFQFLYSFCFKPYCGLGMKAKGICFDFPPDWTRYHRGEDAFYRTTAGRMFSNRIAHYCITNSVDYIKERLDKYYDFFFIDEVQDLAGHDFNLLLSILPDRCDSLFVGDFYQHTYETSNDGNVNHGLYDVYRRYLRKWTDVGVTIDTTTLSRTHRCSAEVCTPQHCICVFSTKSSCQLLLQHPSTFSSTFYKRHTVHDSRSHRYLFHRYVGKNHPRTGNRNGRVVWIARD